MFVGHLCVFGEMSKFFCSFFLIRLFVLLLLICINSRVQLSTIPWTIAHQAPLSMGFPRQEYWSGFPFPIPGESSQPRDRIWVSCIAGRFFTIRKCILRSVYILEIKALSVVLFANILYHSASCIFVPFMVSFALQDLLSLIRSPFFYIACETDQLIYLLLFPSPYNTVRQK